MTPTRSRVRLDELLLARGLARSRAEAGSLILAGRVRLPTGTVAKAGRLVPDDLVVDVVGAARFVSRGGEKLASALRAFDVAPAGRVCLDVGASTGGFTDCLLAHGAGRVYAVDVGRGQLDARLRQDARVSVLEGVNARRLDPAIFDPRPDLAAIDVAFISLTLVLPAVAACLDGGEIVALVKPQFEVGRGAVGKGGVVRRAADRAGAVRKVLETAGRLALAVTGVAASPLRGPKGNVEVFVHLRAGHPGLDADAVEAALHQAVGGPA